MQNSDLCRAIYDILKKCITDKEQVMASMTCTEKALSNSYAAAPGKTVNKRYPETLKIAALAEINRMLGSSEIAGQVKCLLATDKNDSPHCPLLDTAVFGPFRVAARCLVDKFTTPVGCLS
ncbi:hypothetical protein L596_020868 [Steinernema carpocapsae]|uniref:Uncharacterized protein n=1 Tax=Steinernema carpocapsae TaxID=34508 RepID=A0A4U5MUV4_STECR|nr:hypothetical protein L596_020868 [Steinernema carpocapsae]